MSEFIVGRYYIVKDMPEAVFRFERKREAHPMCGYNFGTLYSKKGFIRLPNNMQSDGGLHYLQIGEEFLPSLTETEE